MGPEQIMADAAKNTTDTKGTRPVRARRVMVAARNPVEGVVFGAEDFSQLEECMTEKRGPNSTMSQAISLHRHLTSRR
jgi:hypothetical protein